MEKKTVSLMFLLVALIFTIVGGTFAYLTWQLTEENRNSLVFTVTGDFKCSVDGGGDVNTEGVTFMPVDSSDCNNSEHILKRELTFNVVKNYTNDVKLYSWFNINNLGSYLRGNSNFKWVLSSQESCTEGIVKSGDFSELTEDSEKIILFNDVYNETTISKYYLYMWLDKEETRIPDEDLSSRIFDLSLDGECGENKVSIDSTITEITNYSTTSIPVIITNDNNYAITANISFKDISLVENLEIPANTTINHDVYLSESAYKKGEKDVENYLTIAVMDNGLQINYNQIVGFIPGINYLGQASTSDTDFFGQEFTRANVKTITFMGSNTVPANETRTLQGTIDVSEAGNGSIMAYYYESDTSGQYDFYIGSSDGVVYANPNSSYAFGGKYEKDSPFYETYSGIYSNLVSINGMEYLNTSNVVNMSSMFGGCNSLATLDLSSFDTSKVTNMSYMFSGCNSLAALDLSSFDTSKVTDMRYMFHYCSSLTTLNVSKFDTSSVTNMYALFYKCSSLTALDVAKFDTSKVTNMSYMFEYCSSLTSLNVSNFDTSQVTNMESMFSGCSGLATLNVSNFDTSKVTNMISMFSGCSGLATLNVSNFNTSKVTDMYGMFRDCSILTTLDVSNFETSKVTVMALMFRNCSGLTTLDVSNFETSNVTNMSQMFEYCSSLTTLNVSNFDTSKVTNIRAMFSGCSGLTTLNLSNFDTSKVTFIGTMFAGCSRLTTLNIKKFTFDSVGATSYSYSGMFDNVPTSCRITVGSNSAKSWLNSKFSSYTNVVIG